MCRLTKTALIELDPCGLESRLELFGDKESLNIREAFEVGFTIPDLCWVAGKQRKRDKLVKFAKSCADSVQYLKNSNADAYAKAAMAAAYADAYAAVYAAAADAANAAAYAAYAAYAAGGATYDKKVKLFQDLFISIFSEDH